MEPICKKTWRSDFLRSATSFDELIQLMEVSTQELKEMHKAGVTFDIAHNGDYVFSTKNPAIAHKFNLKPEHIKIKSLTKFRQEVIREMRKDVNLIRKITLSRKS